MSTSFAAFGVIGVVLTCGFGGWIGVAIGSGEIRRLKAAIADLHDESEPSDGARP